MTALAVTYAISGLGVLVFHLAAMPLPWLLGPIFACLVAALLRIPLKGNATLNDLMRSILGVAVGATITWSVLAAMTGMIPTLLMIPVLIFLSGVIGVPYFHRLWGFDVATSYYSAMPGGLQDMLAFGEEAGGDVRALSLIHATRVLIIVSALPFLIQGIWDADLTNPPGQPASDIPLHELILMALCGVLGWQIAKAVGLFGASILGPMIAASALSLAGFLHFRPPAEAIWAAQFFIGMTVGTKYAGVTGEEVRRDVVAALGYCVILIVMAAVFTEAAILLGLAPPLDALLAFAPGGQAEMTILALIAGADAAFVVAHHILRIVTVIVGAPLAARWIGAGPSS